MVMHDQAVDITEDLAKLEKDGSVYACGKYVDGEGSKIWDFKLYEDILRTPEEFMDDGLHEPVEFVCSDKFQTMENK
ncbi:MAG: hypothetical protein IKQ00_02730 [Butyrivibrio sp.]|nr:hypothetical protein [Butyrivibrio sp.]